MNILALLCLALIMFLSSLLVHAVPNDAQHFDHMFCSHVTRNTGGLTQDRYIPTYGYGGYFERCVRSTTSSDRWHCANSNFNVNSARIEGQSWTCDQGQASNFQRVIYAPTTGYDGTIGSGQQLQKATDQFLKK